MSDIPQAREIIERVLINLPGTELRWHRTQLREALAMMTREKPVKRSKAQRRPISALTRRRIFRLAARDVAIHEIANIVGLRNSGRVSEVLNGKR